MDEAPQGAPQPVAGPRWAVIGIFLLTLTAGLAYARAFLMPVVLAFLLALVFSPVRRFLERRGIGSGLAAMLITGSLLALLVAGVLSLAAPVGDWMADAPRIRQQIELKLEGLSGRAQEVREVAEQVEELAEGVTEPGVQEVVVQQPGIATSLALVAPAVLAQMVFTLVLLFFLLASGDMFYEKVVHVMPTLRDKLLAVRIARDIERKLSRYLFTITLINAALGAAIGVAMWALGMPNPLLIGVIGFLLNYIPYVGSMMGIAIAVVVGLANLATLGDAVVAGAVYFALTAIEGQFITPYFVGRSLRLNTVVVFLSVTLWAWLWSVVGMLVATPLLVTVRAFCEHIPSLRPLGDFLSERGAELEPTEEPPAAASRPPPT